MIEKKISDPFLRDETKLGEIDEAIRTKHLNQVGIYCLSADPTQILMWSHYAESHHGCCLEFSTAQMPFYVSRPVQYPPSYPDFNYLQLWKSGNRQEIVKALLFTKSKLWKYEQEWRVLEFKGPRKLYSYEPGALTGIIFGHWMNQEDKDSIRRLTEKSNSPLQLYQARPWKREFKMEIVPLS
jgi:hypothetical protein